MATSSRSIPQKRSRSPRLKTGSIAFTRATNASRTSSVTRPESLLSDFSVWSEATRLMKRDRLPVAGGGLDGKVVVVTGGTGYLGSSVCKAFAETGATVVSVYLLDREIPYFEKVLGALGKNVTLLKADVMQPGEMDRVTKEILPRLKRIDVLVNTVGGYMAGAVEETSAEDFDRAMALNLKATYPACKARVPSLRASKWVTTDHVARVIRWLCSDDAAPITGAAIPVYGGA